MVQMHTSDQSSGLRIEGGALSPGKWGHVAVSIDGSGHASLVVDGKKVAQGDFQGIVPFFMSSYNIFVLTFSAPHERVHSTCEHVACLRMRTILSLDLVYSSVQIVGHGRLPVLVVDNLTVTIIAPLLFLLYFPLVVSPLSCECCCPEPFMLCRALGSRMEVEDCELALGVSFETDHGLCAHVYDFRLWGHALTPADIASGRKVSNNAKMMPNRS